MLRITYQGNGFAISAWPEEIVGPQPPVWGMAGSSCMPRVVLDSSDGLGKARIENFRARVHYWMVSETEPVFGISMGRHPDQGDDRIYPVHPSRYSLNVVTAGFSDRCMPGAYTVAPDAFTWSMAIDSHDIWIEGGFKDCNLGWVVFADRIDPYTLRQDHNPEAIETIWHPDWPIWCTELRIHRNSNPVKMPRHWWIPPLRCPTMYRKGPNEVNTPYDMIPCEVPMCMVNADAPVEGIVCRHMSARIGKRRANRESKWEAGIHAPVSLIVHNYIPGRQRVRVAIEASAGVDDHAIAAWPRRTGDVGRRVAIPGSQPLNVELYGLAGQEYCAICESFEWSHRHASSGDEEEAAGGDGGVGGDRPGDL